VTTASYGDPDDESDFFSLTTTPNRSLTVGVSPARGQAVDLQRKWNGNWVTVSRATAPTGALWQLMEVPVPTRAGTGTYRTVVRGTTWSRQGISQPFSLHQTDYAKYKSYLASARQHMARFCPGTPIYINTPDVLPGNPYNRIGQATGSWQWPAGSSPGFLKTRIELRSGMAGTELKAVALHECAHIVQYRAVIEDKRDLELQRAWNLWRSTGDEGQADCMQYVFTKSKLYFGYVTGCTTTQVANATRMWQDYGLEYQANPYVWHSDGAALSGPPAHGTAVNGTTHR
jgi:hypothetical protein